MVVDGDIARARVAATHAGRLCAGHFPGDPFLPGAYLVELMAGLAAALLGRSAGHPVAVERAAFRFPVRPGDGAVVTATRRGDAAADVEVLVDGRRAAHASVRFASPP